MFLKCYYLFCFFLQAKLILAFHFDTVGSFKPLTEK